MNKKSLGLKKGTLNKRGFEIVSMEQSFNSPLLDFFGKISTINPIENQTPQEFNYISFRRKYARKQPKKV